MQQSLCSSYVLFDLLLKILKGFESNKIDQKVFVLWYAILHICVQRLKLKTIADV